MDDAQRDVIAFLRDPGSYVPGTGPVEIVETHASLVFLAGRRAYQLKRAVNYPYLDFSTVARRRAACTAELRLNRRTAPQLYLEVRALSRLADGSIVWGRPDDAQAGEPIDFVVVMQRFDQRDLLENLAAAGGLSAPLIHALCTHVAAFHDKAEQRPDHGGASAMSGLIATNVGILRNCRSAGFDQAQVDRIEAALIADLASQGGLLDERRAAGRVRR